MKTQILTQPIYVDTQNRTTFCCPQCGKSKEVDVSKYQGAAIPPKVKCPCGYRFRVPLGAHASRLVRCQVCDGKGYRMALQEKKMVVSEIGYAYHPRYRKEACVVCQHTGLLQTQGRPRIPRNHPGATASCRGVLALPHVLLGFLVVRTLGGLDWLMAQRDTKHWPRLRAALEMDLEKLIKRKTRVRFGH